MAAVFCENAADCKAETWAKRLARYDRLEFAISDAAGAVSDLARIRRDGPGASPLEYGRDIFHTTMEA